LPEEEAAIRKATYLLYNIVNMHPFLDGNKRTAFEVAKNFLRLDGWTFKPEEQEAFNIFIATASGKRDVKEIESWIGRNLRKADE
jgi:death-on-curing protein